MPRDRRLGAQQREWWVSGQSNFVHSNLQNASTSPLNGNWPKQHYQWETKHLVRESDDVRTGGSLRNKCDPSSASSSDFTFRLLATSSGSIIPTWYQGAAPSYQELSACVNYCRRFRHLTISVSDSPSRSLLFSLGLPWDRWIESGIF